MSRDDALHVWLERGLASGEWRAVDADFARFGAQCAPQAPVAALLASACLSRRVGDGHVCLDLDALSASAGPCERWLAQCWRDDPTSLDAPGWIGDGDVLTPLVRQGARLYLWRHWASEQAVARALAHRLQNPPPVPHANALRPWIEALFGPVPASPSPTSPAPDWQRLACALATRTSLFVLTGGPGTGKTTTVVRLLALLQGLAIQQGRRPLRIGLAAPTGKAAARLDQSIGAAIDHLPWLALPLDADQSATLRAHLPARAQTVHRLIGRHSDGTGARHDARHPLWLDWLVIDEASMIDLELLHDTLQALPAHTRLVLIGDRDQLASVEAGSVLAHLCARARDGHYTPALADWACAATGQTIPAALQDPAGEPLDQAVVMLRHSRRFDARSGIGRWAAAVNAGNVDELQALLQRPAADVAVLMPAAPADARGDTAAQHAWRGVLLPAWAELLRHLRQGPADDSPAALDHWARTALALHGGVQVLCALREGPWGVRGINARLVQLLRAEGLLPAEVTSPDGWYAGRPVLVTRNAPELGLMNGDLGLVLPLPAPRGAPAAAVRWRAAFAAPDLPGGVRWALPGQLAHLETAFALTVHKSQGSEFDHVLLALPPDPDNPILTRELLYTGITRARQRLTLLLPGGPHALLAAARRHTQRDGGLRDALRAALCQPNDLAEPPI
ncbi:RecBCD enzyme subunit RecD [Tepidimonas thermarum]|uniref:RecBCD enzyme subunit RecD n=1 Tax=Tepidimonas thermarum TaxID=335431 RepID=A0A554X586_9BURK|nr:exodeoxyribonuclease V subunit alpha [Tepidimonas thermarum]TSE30993.1 RecBCD enzyme subunit RecD [Tepidimonas thermarum]